MTILCIGSINIDDVYSVPDIARPGETISSSHFNQYPGGKGSNQSIAIAKAGYNVTHFGKIGTDGKWVLDIMGKAGVDVSKIKISESVATGKAIIQVSSNTGDNAIILFPGCNHLVLVDELDEVMDSPYNCYLLQNEINLEAAKHAISVAKAKRVLVCLNPAPCPRTLNDYVDMNLANILIFNKIEAAEILYLTSGVNGNNPDDIIQQLAEIYYNVSVIIITLGGDGAIALVRNDCKTILIKEPVTRKISVVDTTGAGDTFVGYFLGRFLDLSSSNLTLGLQDPMIVKNAMKVAILASGRSCEMNGAASSIPTIAEVNKFLE